MNIVEWFLFLLSIPAVLFGTPPVLELSRDGAPVSFKNHSVLLFHPGPEDYSGLNVDDSAWAHVSPPHVWKKGSLPGKSQTAWYRLHFRYTNGLPDYTPGVELGKIADIDDVWLNGVFVGRNGYVLSNQNVYAFDKHRIYMLPFHALRTNGDNVLSVRVKEYDTDCGLYAGNYRFGSYAALYGRLLFFETVKIMFVVVYVVIAVYFLLLFIRRTRDREYFWFGLFALFASVYFSMLSELKYFLSTDYLLLKRIEFSTLALMVPIFLQFFLQFFRHPRHLFDRIFMGISAAAFLVLQFLPDPAAMWRLFAWVIQASWIFGIGRILYLLFTYLRLEVDARLMSAGLLVLASTVVWDVAASRSSAIYSIAGFLSTYGFLFFTVGIAFVLANRLVRLHREVESLNNDLQASFTTIKEQNNQLLQVDRIKNELMASVSHEMRTPVSNIYGAVELLVNRDVDLSDEEQARAMFLSIHNQIRLLKHIISNFLVLSTLENSSEYRTKIQIIDFFREFRERLIDGEYSNLIRDKALSVLYPVLTSVPANTVIEADAEYLRHMLGEIVHNAIIYNKQGGTFSVDAFTENGYLTVFIEDTGIGISRDHLENVFDRFYRESGRTDANVPGTGLGLSVVRYICDRWNWSIDIQSEPGIYTRVTVGNIRTTGQEAAHGDSSLL